MTEVKYNIGGGKEIIAEYDDDGIMEITRECFEMLIDEKIPKEPIDKIMYKECPICGSVELGKHCMECGQAIKWE